MTYLLKRASVIFLLPLLVHASENKISYSTSSLSLQQAVARNLSQDKRIKIEVLRSIQAGERVNEEKSIYDPILKADAGTSLVHGGYSASAAVSKLIPTGGTFEVGVIASNDTDGSLYAEFRQPLLRGRGSFYTNSKIQIAKIEQAIGGLKLRGARIDQTADLMDLFWRLSGTEERLSYEKKYLKNVDSTIASLQSKIDAGTKQMPDLFIFIREKSEVEEEIRRLNSEREEAVDQLATRMGERSDHNSYFLVDVLTENLPAVPKESVEELVQIARMYRVDVAEAELGIDIADIKIKRAANEKLIQFDAILRGMVSGGGDRGGSGDDLYAGVEMRVPLGNRGARSRHKIAQRDKEIAELNKETVLDEIRNQLSQSRRDLIRASESYQNSKLRRGQAEAILKMQQDTFTQGLGSVESLLDAFRNVRAFHREEIGYAVELRKSNTEMGRRLGTLLWEVNLEVDTFSGFQSISSK